MGLSQILMEGKFHVGAHVRDLNMFSRTETHCLLSCDVTSHNAVDVLCTTTTFVDFIPTTCYCSDGQILSLALQYRLAATALSISCSPNTCC